MKTRKPKPTPPTERRERHEGADIDGLVSAYRRSVDQRDGSYWERQRVNYETRYCLWRNQSWDGRKWRRSDGKKPFPWLGASDARVPLVDLYIREDAAKLMTAWTRQRVMARPTSAAKHAADAGRLTQLLRWLIYEEMEETAEEAELLANYYLERGSAALSVWWCREEQLTRETIDLAQIEAAAKQAMAQLQRGVQSDALVIAAQLPQMILDPTMTQEVAELIRGAVGDALPTERLRRVVKDLRDSGVAHFPRAVVVRDRPRVRALAWNEDVIIPPECVDVQRARHVFIRETLTETDLVDRSRSYGYDADWVDAVVSRARGKMSFDPSERAASRSTPWSRGDMDSSELFEVVTGYERLCDDDGIPGIYTTVFAPGLRAQRSAIPEVGKHELLDYAHAQYPIVPFVLERRSRCVDDSRGYGERAHTWQQQIKRQWDARTDRADVATLPPSYHPPGEEPDAWGPGVQVATIQSERFGYFETPKNDPGSMDVEMTVRQFADEYFGRRPEKANTAESAAVREELARGWFQGWKRASTQILQLCQQYLPDEVMVRVVGSDQGRSVRVTREEIQGPFNVAIQFNMGDLDPELVKPKIEMLQQAIAMDVGGRLDRGEALIAAMELIDPGYAERLVRPGDAVTLEQIDDEQSVLAKLILGIGVDVRGDEAFGLRKATLLKTIEGSPTVQQILRSNPQAAELVQRRVEQLDFNIQQKLVNPEIGRRLGGAPMSAMKAQPGDGGGL